MLSAKLEEPAHRRGGAREHDVVHGRAEGAADVLQVRQRPPGTGKMAKRRYRLVEGRDRVRRPQGARESAGGLLAVACKPEERFRRRDDPDRKPHEVEVGADLVQTGSGKAADDSWDGGGAPRVRLGGGWIGSRVEQKRGELHRGDPVDHAVMSLPDDADAAVLEA